jgi:ribosomal protein S18 acetylase RimI-like enzyme
MAEMAAALVRFHHELDPARFFLAANVERGYRGWFAQELLNPEAILLVAERDGVLSGYTYGRIEARDWNMLLDRHAALHDVFVREEARKTGLADQLVHAFLDESARAGAPRVVLHTASQNHRAQAVFSRLGFRPTMVEMMVELPKKP